MKKDTPYIQLFTSPNSYYVFDVNRNELLELGKDSYTYLLDLLAGRETAEAPEMIRSLREEGYLSSNRVSTVQHPYTPYLEDMLDRGIEQVTLQVTQNCNFRCAYCGYTQQSDAQRCHSDKRMSEETARKALLFVRDHSIDSKEVSIGFYGGEPLIEFELIQRLVAYCEEIFRGKKHVYSITTNATLLTDSMLEFMGKYDFRLMVSLDGPRKINDKNRVFVNGEGTYQKVMERLNHIYRNYPDFFRRKLSVNMVLDPSNAFDEIIQIFPEEEVMREIVVRTSVVDDIYSSEPVEYSNTYRWQYQYQSFLGLLAQIGRYPSEQVSPIIKSQFELTLDNVEKIVPRVGLSETLAPGGPCIPGKLRLFVTTDGDLLPCERVSETSEVLKIGSLEKGLDIERIKALLNVGSLTPEACRNCWAFNGCSLCCKHADKQTCLDGAAKLKHCEGTKKDFAHSLLFKIFFHEVHTQYAQKGGAEA